MQKYILAYHGGKSFETKEQGAEHMENWRAWSAGLKDAVVDPGMPVGPSKTVTASGVIDNGGANPLSGITIIQADSIDAAIAMAQQCPHVHIGGTIEVAQAMQMEM
jgi:hypothetical protein